MESTTTRTPSDRSLLAHLEPKAPDALRTAPEAARPLAACLNALVAADQQEERGRSAVANSDRKGGSVNAAAVHAIASRPVSSSSPATPGGLLSLYAWAPPTTRAEGSSPPLVAETPSGVLLAKTWDKKRDLTGYWISEKYDGVRAYWTGDQLVSRKGNVLAAPDWFIEGLPNYPLDGELWLGYGRFSEGNGVVNSKDPGKYNRWREVTFLVFDAPGLDLPFEDRVSFMQKNHPPGTHPHARIVQHARAESNAQVLSLLAEIEAKGGEGLMARAPASRYENKRSSSLLKIKNFHDMEAQIVGYRMPDGSVVRGANARTEVEAQGRVRSLLMATKEGIEFGLSLRTQAQRCDPPNIGEIVTFTYKELSVNGKPCKTTFVDVRHDHDWGEKEANAKAA